MPEMRDTYGRALAEYGAQNERVVALDADVSASTRSRYFGDRFPDRFYNVGITEAAMVDVAAGLALGGMIPFAHTFAFLLALRAAEQVRTCVAYARTNVKLVGAYGGLSDSKDGPTHHSICDLAVMRALPNLTVIVPADGIEAAACVPVVAELDGPVYLRLSRADVPDLMPEGYRFQVGKGAVLREGRDVAIVNCGVLLSRCLRAAEELASRGISATVVNLPTLKPLDEELLLQVAEAGAVVTVEEHTVIGGLGGAVAEFLSAHRPTPLQMVGIHDTFTETGPYEGLLDRWGMSVADIVAACQRALAAVG
ncbi:MAG: transketolase family protein [Anaerolineae bacterium]|nr:transketolase family protein [Anaerolineae bacterium]